MTEPASPERLKWAIEARARSQRLLLALYRVGEQKGHRSPKNVDAENETTWLFTLLVGVAFSLWRAAFLTDMPTRTWPEALQDAQKLLETVLSTNTILFGIEHTLRGWTGGFYLNNAKLRLLEATGSVPSNGGNWSHESVSC